MPKREIKPQLGPQTMFSLCESDIAIYGGSAGGGKSWSLAYEAARYTNIQNYAAVIFRRTSPELQGGGSIFEEARRIYPHLHGVPRESPNLDWRFPRTNAVVEFRHLQHEHSVYAHQSKAYDFIGLDEMTHFSASQFWYMLSRLRSRTGVPKKMRGTCNPDPDSFVRGLISWWIGDDGLAIEERSGIARWFVRLDERLIWGNSPDEVWEQEPQRIRRPGSAPRGPLDVRPEPLSITFIRARASDNQALMQSDPGYLARLNLIPGAQSKRLRDGNWDARDQPGDYFDRSWVKVVDHVPSLNVKRRVRFWDKAATTPSAASPDPDWTRGVRIALMDDGTYIVDDLVSKRAGPAEIDKLILSTARSDGIEVEVGAWQDPGQAGVVDIEHMRSLLVGFAFNSVRAVKNKETYAMVWSPLAKAGRVQFQQREYLPELFGELEGFPLRTHDDIMDAISGCFQLLFPGQWTPSYDSASSPRHGGPLRDAWDEADDDDDDAGFGRVGRTSQHGRGF